MNGFWDWLTKTKVIVAFHLFFRKSISIVLLSFIVINQPQSLFIYVGEDPRAVMVFAANAAVIFEPCYDVIPVPILQKSASVCSCGSMRLQLSSLNTICFRILSVAMIKQKWRTRGNITSSQHNTTIALLREVIFCFAAGF